MEALALLFLTTILATSHASHVGEALKPLPIHLLRPLTGSGGHHVHGILCTSWRLAVETNNIRNWTTVPLSCEKYVGHYMLGDLYRKDSKVVADAAAIYAASLKLKGDGKDIWVFDVDETVLSNLPYFAKHGFGAEPFNSTLSNEWVDLGKAPPLPESLKLYKKLLSLGIKVVFLTGRREVKRKITEKNLKNAGFHTWEKVILRLPEEEGAAIVFKSNRRRILEDKGYRIVGNMGDQWSDILGTNVGQRTFKVPDPMYYIS
ncbi:acid phosphatase 1-like [Magnolia sinica]|uniref:acid phosphatase 1-like n=1 Tax=Magnolia sinica TaxID=86752 RepID=UPI00265A5371|nr:acid phosphatase 1-like [Magnolia sinica]